MDKTRKKLSPIQRREYTKLKVQQMNEARLKRLRELLSERAANPPPEGSEAPQGEPEHEPEPIPEPRKAFRVPSPSELTEGRFPKVFSASQKWARTVSRERGEQFAPQFNSVVCALHFRTCDTYVDSSGNTALLPNARPRPEPYTQEEQEKENELFEKLQEEIAKRKEKGEGEQKERPRKRKEVVKGNEENESVIRKRPKKSKYMKRQEEIAKRKQEREREKKRMREEKKRARKSKKTAEVVLPSFVPEMPNLELYNELNTAVDSFGNTLPIERNPLKIEAKTELERAVQSIATELKPPENAITLQYLDLYSESATVHYLSVDSGNIVNVGHTQVNIQKDNIATLNYVDSDNTVKHTLRCVNIEHDPSMSALTENDTSANDSVLKTEAPGTNPPDISDSINLFTDNPSISKCIIKEEPITNDESDPNVTNGETIVEVTEGTIKIELESDPNVTNDETIVEVTDGTIKIEHETDESDSETVVKMEIEEFDGQVFKLF